MEWLQANWLWLVLVVGGAWLLFGRGGMGCGMGGHGGHGSHDGEAQDRDSETATPRRRRGC